MANCAYHPEAEAVGACVNCGRLICNECKVVLGEKIYCNPCANKLFSGEPQAVAGGAGTAATTAENTSGQGSRAILPPGVGGWNWGAFLLSWIWAIGNNVWIGLLALVPYVGFIMAIVLGVKGSEWAWQNKRWDSVEHFKKTQSTWTKWGVGLFIFGIAISVLCIIAAVATEY